MNGSRFTAEYDPVRRKILITVYHDRVHPIREWLTTAQADEVRAEIAKAIADHDRD